MGEQAEGILARLMRAYDVHDDGALAIHLGRDLSTIRVWKSRDMVPLMVLTEASKATGYSVQWLRGEDGAPESASTRTPDHDASRVALSRREAELIERYRATTEDGRTAVELVTSTLASPASKSRKAGSANPPKVGSYPPSGDAPVAVLSMREADAPWRDVHPVKHDTIKAGGRQADSPTALLPVSGISASRPLVLSISLGDAGETANYEVIPKFIGAASAGRAQAAEKKPADGLDQIGDMAFSHGWLRDNLGHTSGQLASIKVRGDSMAGTLIDGETIIIDTSINRVDVSGIYVIDAHGDRLVKRIDRKLDNSLVIISDNKNYQAETVPAGRQDDIKVIGRMVWPRQR